jgi:hypothetical protein
VEPVPVDPSGRMGRPRRSSISHLTTRTPGVPGLYELPPPLQSSRARKTVELGYKTAASGFSYRSSASCSRLLVVDPYMLFAISCCSCVVGKHGRARANGEEAEDRRTERCCRHFLALRGTAAIVQTNFDSRGHRCVGYWYNM